MDKYDEILCLSGGLDSYIAYFYLDMPPTIYFDTRQPHTEKEFNRVNHISKSTIIDHSLNFAKHDGEVYIPHRNLLFASRASVYAKKVWIIGLKDDMVEDKTSGAFDLMSLCLSGIGKEDVIVDSPFWNMTKSDICKWYVNYINVTENSLLGCEDFLNKMSVSCYAGGMQPCQKCKSCFRKACAMFNADMHSPFSNTSMVIDYNQEAFLGKYITERNDDIIRYAEWYKHTHLNEWNDITLQNYLNA